MEKLFSEFKPVSAAGWKQQIIKDLKGAPYENLVWHNQNGFDVEPFYTGDDAREAEPVFTHSTWEIVEEIAVQDERAANAKALRALASGASGLHFILSRKPNLNALLEGISIRHIELSFILRYHDRDFRARFHSYLDYHGVGANEVNGSVCFDPLSHLAQAGNWFSSEEADMDWNNTWINAWIYQNAGATQSFELACALAHAHEYLHRSASASKYRFSLSIGSDFFGEIAKLRALRKLWRLVAGGYKANETISIHACNSHLNLSHLDAYNNMLRTTTEAMSAILGGCNSLTLEAYNKAFGRTNDFSERIARNQQLILREESYFDKIGDAAAGSYYIEWLTDALAGKAWEEFKAIEARGGLIACLRAGFIQQTIKSQAEQLIEAFRNEKLVLVGVNKFRNKQERVKPMPSIKRIATGAAVMPLSKICLSDYLVKENA